jgi:hypothetical protein
VDAAALLSFLDYLEQNWTGIKVAPMVSPVNLGDWFYERVRQWSESQLDRPACVHMFRKTTLQYALAGENVIQQVADDARLGAGVMMTNYAEERDLEMREKSNRTFRRIAASLPLNVAQRYGHRLSAEQSIDVSPCETRAYEVRPKGFEPLTLGSEDRCSIQLSYGRK